MTRQKEIFFFTITRNCFVLFSANKFVNLDMFPRRYSLSKLTPVETESLKDYFLYRNREYYKRTTSREKHQAQWFHRGAFTKSSKIR